MKTKILRLPKAPIVLICIGIGILQLLFLNLSSYVYHVIIHPHLSGAYSDQMITEGISALFSLILLCFFGYSSILKEKGEGLTKGLYASSYYIAYISYHAIYSTYSCLMESQVSICGFGEILSFVSTMLLIGITEELLCRGIVLNLLLDRFSNTKRGIWSAIIIASSLFGLLHLPNIFAGASPKAVLMQAVSATAGGILFSAIYIRSNNIWIPILAHAAFDFMALIPSGIFGMSTIVEHLNNTSMLSLLKSSVEIIPALILLKPSKLDEVILRRQNNQTCTNEVKAVHSGKTDAIISILFGATSIVLGFTGMFWGIGFIGILAGRLSKKQKPANNKLAQIGFILSLIGTIFGIVCATGFILSFSSMGHFDKYIFKQKYPL